MREREAEGKGAGGRERGSEKITKEGVTGRRNKAKWKLRKMRETGGIYKRGKEEWEEKIEGR